jgi:hypothetical protein
MERYTSLTKERLLNFKARVNELSVPKVITFLNSDGTPFDISALGFKIPVKQNTYSRTNVFELTIGDGLTIQGDDNNELKIEVSAERATVRPDVYFGTLFSTVEGKTWLNGDWEFHNGKYDGVTETDAIIVYQNGGDVLITIQGGSSTSGTSIQFQDEGVDLGNNQANTVNFTGNLVTAKRVGDEIIVDINSLPESTTIETLVDDGGGLIHYNGFPYPDLMEDNSIITGWKRSATHADKGPFMLKRSSNGGSSWTERQVTVDGLDVECAALSLKVVGNYVHIAYQDDELYTSVKFARILQSELISDFENADFESTTTLNFLADYSSSPFSQMVVMPSGKIFQPYYSVGTGPNAGKSISALIETTDNGVTWSFGPVIYTEASPNPVPGEVVSETAVAIVEEGATDADTKLVAYLRNETHQFYSHASSTDGGETWTIDPVNFFYEFGNQVARSPVAVILYNGLVYIICGRRDVSEVYTIEYVTCSVADALTNNQSGYSANVVIDYTSNAQSNGAAIDWGYPNPFVDSNGGLWCHFYDTSATQDGGDRNCIIYQINLVGGSGSSVPGLDEVLIAGNNGGGEQIKNIGAPTDDDDAATKEYVDDGDASTLASAQTYANNLVVGLWDDRGNFSAAGGAYPSSGGSGTAGAILKGDIWTISVAGTLPTGQAVNVGDTVRALVDTPGNTQANWAIAENNIGYVPENVANKDQNSGYVGRDSSGGATVVDITVSSTTASTLAFISSAKKLITATGALLGTWIAALTGKSTPVDADILLVGDSTASNQSKITTFTQAWTNYFKVKADLLYQVLNANLTILGGLTATTDNVIQSKAGAWASRTLAQFRADLFNARFYAHFYSDFGAMLAPYVNSASGTGASAGISSIAGNATNPGTATCSTGSTSSGQAYITLSATFNNFLLGGGSWFFDCVQYINVLSTVSERFVVVIGYHDSPSTSDATDGCYFRYSDDVNGGRWQAITRSNSVETGTNTDTGVSPSAATFQRFTIEVNAAGTQVTYYINGTQVAQHSANIPTGSGRQSTWCTGIRKTVGGTAMSIVVDMTNTINELTTGR